ncbi:MAG: iron donor protein CyaY [Polyangiaceae bacterium]
MDERTYQKLADVVLRKVDDAFKDVDADVVDCERAGDVITLTFANGKRCVLNTQRPTRQMWLAANARGWHFQYDEAKSLWLDDKSGRDELFATLAGIVKEQASLDLAFG